MLSQIYIEQSRIGRGLLHCIAKTETSIISLLILLPLPLLCPKIPQTSPLSITPLVCSGTTHLSKDGCNADFQASDWSTQNHSDLSLVKITPWLFLHLQQPPPTTSLSYFSLSITSTSQFSTFLTEHYLNYIRRFRNTFVLVT